MHTTAFNNYSQIHTIAALSKFVLQLCRNFINDFPYLKKKVIFRAIKLFGLHKKHVTLLYLKDRLNSDKSLRKVYIYVDVIPIKAYNIKLYHKKC